MGELSFPVSPGKLEDLRRRMASLGLREVDLTESFFRCSGPGGTKNAKTSSGVTLLHAVTGVRVRCQRERSQGLNRFLARRLLVEELEARLQGKNRHQVKAEKLRAEKERSHRHGSRPREHSEGKGGHAFDPSAPFIVKHWPAQFPPLSQETPWKEAD